ncbi:SufS family cysteine desulfurase [Prochlorococcus sp. MIT 1300]|uniref:SufS family cysteine desulfurase n=1 Tax=Prochlorococcus sp. MIT 1300 TaxID=3096218 RepID=UPI002A761649|nr:SufS family cysteine desulfurase [Prochlorococcus sp. MIT 1300]
MSEAKQNPAEKAREDFPLLTSNFSSERSLIYLDHAATTQKPKSVITALENYYKNDNANVHRGAHQLSARATEAFEGAREITSNFIKAKSSKEILFTRNATEAINLVARSWGDNVIKEGDEILLTLMEHHSNLVPWQLLSKRTGCILRHVGITPSGELDIADLSSKLNERTRLVSLVHISNTLGCCNPISEVATLAHKVGALVLVDACQSLAHQIIDVGALDIDFLVGSSHKLCGPTGIGFLWGHEEILEAMPPFLGGGEMIQEVFLDQSSWAELPHKFEAGTPAIGEAIGMGEALSYLQGIGLDNIHSWEKTLTNYLFNSLSSIDNIKILGPSPQQQSNRGVLATFYVPGLHSNDIATLLDENGICIRSGHHCCQPLHRHYEVTSTARASLNFTSTIEEIDLFKEELIESINFLKAHS